MNEPAGFSNPSVFPDVGSVVLSSPIFDIDAVLSYGSGDQRGNYVINSNTCYQGFSCDVFLQMNWDTLVAVGCSHQECGSISGASGSDSELFVCIFSSP